MSQAQSNKEMQLTTPLTAIAPYKSKGRTFAIPEQFLDGTCPARS